MGGVPALEVLADQLDDAVLLEVDTYWAAVGGQDVAALLRRLGDRVRYLHVKDGPVVDRDDFMTAVGAGRMPVAEILAASPSARWHVVELDRCATDMMTAVGDSLAWLAGQGLAQPAPDGREWRLMTAGRAGRRRRRRLRDHQPRVPAQPDVVSRPARAVLRRHRPRAGQGAGRQVRRARGRDSGPGAAANPDVELVVNLTIPAAHAEVTSAALAAGKSVWTEKPLALDTATGQRLLGRGGPGRRCGSAAHPTPCSAPGSRPPGG